ncbi:MAG: hypothetical protein HUU21_40200 [Polyangiaceae bacterium]|nr:hypothetical protein [Polyangiaceae bacterium]
MTKVTPVHFSERFSRADYQMLAIGVAGGCLLLLSLPLANVILARTLGTVMLLVIALALGMRFSAYDLPLKGAFVTWLVAALLSLFSLEHPSQAFRLIWSEVLKDEFGLLGVESLENGANGSEIGLVPGVELGHGIPNGCIERRGLGSGAVFCELREQRPRELVLLLRIAFLGKRGPNRGRFAHSH